ncbi:hypothetical protein QTI66_30710 [Variovorax sp. J22R133]|uniref:hypothetical protein n=1 Tax=Variovorax brevis TaxID=3053503 RepID=UPI002577655B|nr:hypothetical protein [Variovorax sp. J22R133]MDM0116521.1 hypothetical protein [Variovorax sp. J22R133]
MKYSKVSRCGVRALPLLAALCLAGCANVGGGVGFGIQLVPGLSLNLGYGAGGAVVGVGTGWGPVGAGVGINQSGQVIGGGGVGVGVSSGNVGAGVGVGQSAVLYDPKAPPQNAYAVPPPATVAQPGSVEAP